MQKLKNILGSRKKGAQEPHAAREQRYDYQGNAPSNLKGISLESLTLPAGLTSYCTVPLFLPVEDFHLTFSSMCDCVCALLCVSLQRAQSWCRMSPGVWATQSLTWALKAIPCSFSSLMSRYLYTLMDHIPYFQSYKCSTPCFKCNSTALSWLQNVCLNFCWFSFNRTRTSRAGQTQCRILRAPLWNLDLYSSSLRTWSRSKRKPFKGKKEGSPCSCLIDKWGSLLVQNIEMTASLLMSYWKRS